MTGAAGAEREQVMRWMEEGRTVVEIVQRVFTEVDRLKAENEAGQKERERLQHEGEQLRAEVGRLKADYERAQKERAETAQWFGAMMNEAVSRLRIERPAA
jgi:FtsZ-binding cell division protein ZapB